MEPWSPNPGPQTEFLAAAAYEVLYGGAAGGGKTDALVMGALRHVGHSGYNGIIFRRTFPELEGQVIPKSQQWYRPCGAHYNGAAHRWVFPSGGRVHFGHMQHEDDKFRYQGLEFQYLGFDELTQFTEGQYTYLLSRARSADGIPIQVRASCNPGGDGQEWVFRRWAPWLDPESPVKATPGQVLWYINEAKGERWVSREEARKTNIAWRAAPPAQRLTMPMALSRAFIPARVQDNPKLVDNDPAYIERLKGLDLVTREQLLHGNWLIRPAAGLLFKRAWFPVVDLAPARGDRLRMWDRAATEPHDGNRDPDWTTGVKMLRTADGSFYVEDVVRFRGKPRAVEETVRATATLDGPMVAVGLWQDPGSAGVHEIDSYKRLLSGFDIRVLPQVKEKIAYARPVSAQAEAGNVRLVRGLWNSAYVAEMEAFPQKGVHDDQVDGTTGAFALLTEDSVAEYIAAMKAVRT